MCTCKCLAIVVNYDCTDGDLRDACGVALRAISQQSLDVFMRHAALALPLAFLAMHNKAESQAADSQTQSPHVVWEEIWSEATPGRIRVSMKNYANLCQ